MNIGDIYKAPWGAYAVLHLEPVVVLRSLDTFNACVIAPADFDPAYIATGEKVKLHVLGPVPPDRYASGDDRGAVPQPVASPPAAPQEPRTDRARAVSTSAALTLGGMRPGLPLCILPGRPALWWRACLTRIEYGSRDPHCWFVSLSNDTSLYCWECRKHKPIVVIVKKGRTYTQAELYALARSQHSPSTSPELSTSMAPASESSGGPGSFVPVVSVSLPPVSRPSIPLVPGTSPKEDVGGFDRTPIPSYRPTTEAAWREELVERAAMIEYCGGLPRATAEMMARTIVGPKPIVFTKGAHYVPDGENYW